MPPLGGADAGTATIKILPDTSQLVPVLRRDLTKASRSPAMRKGVEVPVTPDTDKFAPMLKREIRRAGPRRGLEVPITPDVRHFGRSLNRGVMPGVRSLATAVSGVFAAIAVGGFLADTIAEARDAAKVGRQTNAVIKATGGVANVSAKDVDRLADALSNKVGVDDEIIAAGQNMLLTFKGVRDETGKNNDIFTRATRTAVDMTAALHQGEVTQQGLEKTNIMLGKALQNPIKGISSLTRVGVTFTDQQKEQIKKMVESGDTMGAQKIILGELTTEYGGAAEAAADPWSRLMVVFGNIKESIGTVLLPALNSAATFISEKLIPAARDWWATHGPKVKKAFENIVAAAKAWWTEHGPAVVEAFKDVRDIVAEVWLKITQDYLPALQEIVRFTTEELQPTIDELTQTWRDNKDAMGEVKVGGAGSLDMWKTIAAFLTDIMIKQVERLTTVVGLLARAWTTASRGVNIAITKMVVTFMSANAAMIAGAATVAEALHLPMAAGLRKAADNMKAWVTDFNNNLNNLDDEGVKVDVTGTFGWQGLTPHRVPGTKLWALASGGEVSGPGTATSDSIPAWLSTGEHVLSAREVQGMGGHGTVERMRRRARGMAAGGRVTPTQHLESAAGMIAPAGQTISHLAAAINRLQIAIRMQGLPGVQRALSWARGEVGKPYVWGGVGPGGYDCSGFMSAIANVVMGRGPHRRLFATGSFPTSGWAAGFMPMGFNIGSRRGSPGHMAGTLGNVNVESRGSRGVVVGAGARGARDSLFGGNIWHLTGRSGASPGSHERFVGFDQGGFLQPGATLALNNTGRPEPVGFDYDKLAQAIARNPPKVYLDRERVSHSLATGHLWDARR